MLGLSMPCGAAAAGGGGGAGWLGRGADQAGCSKARGGAAPRDARALSSSSQPPRAAGAPCRRQWSRRARARRPAGTRRGWPRARPQTVSRGSAPPAGRARSARPRRRRPPRLWGSRSASLAARGPRRGAAAPPAGGAGAAGRGGGLGAGERAVWRRRRGNCNQSHSQKPGQTRVKPQSKRAPHLEQGREVGLQAAGLGADREVQVGALERGRPGPAAGGARAQAQLGLDVLKGPGSREAGCEGGRWASGAGFEHLRPPLLPGGGRGQHPPSPRSQAPDAAPLKDRTWRTRSVAVAVSAMMGTSGSVSRSIASWRNAGRKSWPYSEMQWASSTAISAMPWGVFW
jgi:hypothetical protein